MKYRLEYDDIFAAAIRYLRDKKKIEVVGNCKMSVVVEEDRKTGKLMPFVDIEDNCEGP